MDNTETKPLSPHDYLLEALGQNGCILRDLGQLRMTISECYLRVVGKDAAQALVDKARSALLELHGMLSLIECGHQQTIADFGFPVTDGEF